MSSDVDSTMTSSTPWQQRESWISGRDNATRLYGMNRYLCNPHSLMLNSSTAYHFSRVLSNISIHLLPILALATNSLIILVVLCNPQLNRSSFSVYVKSMAVSDTLVLVLKLISYENKTSNIFYWPLLCTVLVFLSETSVLLSVWTIVLLTIERTFVVLFPLHIKKFVSACRARSLIMLIATISLIFSARVLVIEIEVSSNRNKRCNPVVDQQRYRQINAIITEFAYCFIPLFIVIIGNCITLYTVKRAISERRQLVKNPTDYQKRQSENNENQLMLMLFVVTVMFIVYFVPFTITNVISRLGLPFGYCFTQKDFEIYVVIRSLSELLKDLNFCTNFIIYCISGRRFRYALWSLIHRHRARLTSSSRLQDGTKQRSKCLRRQNTTKRICSTSKQVDEESQF